VLSGVSLDELTPVNVRTAARDAAGADRSREALPKQLKPMLAEVAKRPVEPAMRYEPSSTATA